MIIERYIGLVVECYTIIITSQLHENQTRQSSQLLFTWDDSLTTTVESNHLAGSPDSGLVNRRTAEESLKETSDVRASTAPKRQKRMLYIEGARMASFPPSISFVQVCRLPSPRLTPRSLELAEFRDRWTINFCVKISSLAELQYTLTNAKTPLHHHHHQQHLFNLHHYSRHPPIFSTTTPSTCVCLFLLLLFLLFLLLHFSCKISSASSRNGSLPSGNPIKLFLDKSKVSRRKLTANLPCPIPILPLPFFIGTISSQWPQGKTLTWAASFNQRHFVAYKRTVARAAHYAKVTNARSGRSLSPK